MERLILIHNSPKSRNAEGPSSARHTTTDEDYYRLMADLNMLEISPSLVEVFVRQADKEGPGPGGNNFLFETATTSGRHDVS